VENNQNNDAVAGGGEPTGTEFPQNFIWGAAAAAYQIEGAAEEDGRGLSVWDEFSRTPGKIWGNHTGDVAADHYHRYPEDIALMRQIGLRAYRLSISWPRVLPQGVGEVNAKGLDFYDRLIDALLQAGIAPYATLYHWDLPLALQRRGGWMQRDCADWFGEYAQVVADRLSDRVKHWMTLNEPTIFLGLGLQYGAHAPGLSSSLAETLQAAHHVLLAHGKAAQALRAQDQASQIGFALIGYSKIPATEQPEDIAAARAATFGVLDKNIHNNPWWLDPIFCGRYPDDGLALFGEDAPQVLPGDMETISQPLDFAGFNIYSGDFFRAGADGKPEYVPLPLGHPFTAANFSVTPEALYWGPKLLHERYQKPMYITENGFCSWDAIALDGKVHDLQRLDAIARYLLELGRAAREGVPVLGYFYWSIMDNFEWLQGYKDRFGLIFVDYPTQRRVLKDSALWYKDIIASNGAGLAAMLAG
jgi:beta-glucosidase